ncbi:WYL domain-containing protein [Bacteroides thetaiotaomicron]|uniref:WYL domain-containing protein n=1 Tax=Bacteroides thetaiotaomicron TaxID=818 RepID=A0AA46YZ06_BACT4|nr:WYL domain-containing protein [Bacteroides thetaiotaomicron]MBV3852523.1 WYL domain-containing protein [Bacteroides thetaiotaomicron]MBV3924894.1 WYL domain-containing protein [Bacteroides thetaiotaomicron]MBV3930261.1 WYL domain-containing protein [Bacteroides thetaiotaomicron]MBV3939315.1 WYL domain-containing protein [Bacteroides thetaiotaomicron]MBV3953638.1 WYL domain-containing protein [Bacteroides thetaiotaomicron]
MSTKPFTSHQVVDGPKTHVIKLVVRPNKELESCIFPYGNQMEVLKPQWLRKQITEKLEGILIKYSTVQKGCSIEP